MKPICKNSVAAIVLVLALSGCSSIFGGKSARSTPTETLVNAETSPSADMGPATEKGRSLLTEGQNALAIESFRRALASGEAIAPAVNGLGVAYVRLGRFDLAQRYFQQALAIDPSDHRYSDNLERVTLAMTQEIYAVQARNEAASEIVAPKPAQTVETAPADTGMKRLSRGEVQIVTASQADAKALGNKPAVDTANRGNLVRVSRGEVRIVTARSAPRRLVWPPHSLIAGSGPSPAFPSPRLAKGSEHAAACSSNKEQ